MNPFWVIGLVAIVLVVLLWAGGILVVGSRAEKHGNNSGRRTEHPPENPTEVSGGMFRSDPGGTNTPPGS